MADDEKKEINPIAKPIPYQLTVSVFEKKLLLICNDKKTKRVYQSAFTPKQLQGCGYSDQQVGNLQGVCKFIESAKTGEHGLKFNISIEKDVIVGNEQDENEGGGQAVDTSNNKDETDKINEVSVIKISKEDPFFGTKQFIMKLKQVPREQSDINKDHIDDLHAIIEAQAATISELTQRIQKLEKQQASIHIAKYSSSSTNEWIHWNKVEIKPTLNGMITSVESDHIVVGISGFYRIIYRFFSEEFDDTASRWCHLLINDVNVARQAGYRGAPHGEITEVRNLKIGDKIKCYLESKKGTDPTYLGLTIERLRDCVEC